jgi:hypothetical protein
MNQSKDLKDCYEFGCDGTMVEKGETGRSVQYSDTNGSAGIVPEKIYQCRKCKEIQIITDY